jgi:hypothetical protein
VVSTTAPARQPATAFEDCRPRFLSAGRLQPHDSIATSLKPACCREQLRRPLRIEVLVGLRAGRPDGWTAAAIEKLELNARGIDGFAHDAAKRIDLSHQMAFGRAVRRLDYRAYAQLAAGWADDDHLAPQARGRDTRLDAGVTRAHHDDVHDCLCHLPMQKALEDPVQHVHHWSARRSDSSNRERAVCSSRRTISSGAASLARSRAAHQCLTRAR